MDGAGLDFNLFLTFFQRFYMDYGQHLEHISKKGILEVVFQIFRISHRSLPEFFACCILCARARLYFVCNYIIYDNIIINFIDKKLYISTILYWISFYDFYNTRVIQNVNKYRANWKGRWWMRARFHFWFMF